MTRLATLQHKANGYRTAIAKKPDRCIPRTWYGRDSVLPILAVTGKRIEVRLPRRPNESTTWINIGVASYSSTKDALLVDLSQHRLYVFHNGKQKASYPVGVGRPQTPTPTGTYFVAFHAPPNGPEYGSVMLETSAHSTVFKTFEGGNDAIIAIHGSIYSDKEIGNHGVAISNGCIRMHEWQLVHAAQVPDGAPVIFHH